jgi:mono/diheme cytochrome c family protein
MYPELTKIIADYLAGELNEADRKVFEDRLKNDSKLQEEVAFQQTIIEAAKRSSVRTQVQQSAKGFHLQQTVKWSVLTIAGIVLVSALTYFIYKNSSSKTADISQFKDLIEQVDKNTLISNLAPEYFAWNGKDTAMLSKNGILISIPESAFLLNGKPYTEPALIQFQEALDAATIVKAGLSTTSNGKLLETQGMFSFKALSKDGELLTINPKTGIYVQVPVDEYKDGMQLFSGVPDKNGIINWVDPKPLSKIPVPIDMAKLNFYPPGYEDSLNTMKLNKSKKFRDSLYLSCEDEFSSSTQNPTVEEKSGKYLFEKKCSMCHVLNRESTGPNLANIREIWSKGGAKPNSIYQWVRNWEKAASEDSYALTVSYKTPSASSNFPSLSNTEIDAIFDYVDGSVKSENTANFSILSTNLIYPKGDNSIKNKVNWTYSIEYINNNEAIITAKGIFNDASWGFVDIPKPFSKNKLTYQSSKAVDFNFEFSDEFTPIGNVSYDIKQFKKVCAEFSWSPNFILCSQKIRINGSSISNIRFTNNYQISTEGYPFLLTQEVVLTKNVKESSQHIPPSNVLAFWKPKFNNTILATHDFEKRMQAIHGTCNKKVLEVYTKNLGKSMVELDRQVVQMGYSNFEEFAAENIGALNPNNPHIKGLQAFYEKGIAALQNEVNNYRKTEAKRREKWDKNVNEERMKETNRTIQRENQAFSEEYNLNHKNVRKQLGRTLGAVIYTNASVSNIDRFVLQTTLARKTGEFYDKETGKTARIQYNDFSFEVDKPEQYELVYAYLFPSKLNSYQRISGNKGKFSYALNDAIVYDLAIVAISEKGYSYFQKSNLNEGNLGTIKLERVSEAKVNASIEQLNSNRISTPMRVADELSWLKTEQQNYVERRNRQNQYLFHERIKKIVFPCYEGDDTKDFLADSLNFIVF